MIKQAFQIFKTQMENEKNYIIKMITEKNMISNKSIALAIIVSALGFFVDLYDIMALGAIGKQSLKAVGIKELEIESSLISLQNYQMTGMLIGGFLWGMIGDKFGRIQVLFGSIILYSTFTLLNAFVNDIEQYKWCRLLAGLGLAGELGAGITLVTEQIKKERRGLGPAIIAGFGVLGAVVAVLIGKYYDWKTVYMVGGVLGFLLLFLRVGVVESGLFAAVKKKAVSKGNLLIIIRDKNNLKKFLCILLCGMPGWYVNGVMMQLTDGIAQSMNMQQLPDKGTVIICFFIALCIGDVMGGIVSQWFKSRKKSIQLFLILHLIFLTLFFTVGKSSAAVYYILFACLGLTVGFVIQLFTLAAEQFGTNIRTLVTSSGLNLIRAWVIPFGILYQWINSNFSLLKWETAAIMGFSVAIIALLALTQLEETFHNDLEFVNE